MKKTILILSTIFTFSTVYGQIQPVDVADLTIKVGALGSEELFYGFAEGDQIVFSFEEVKGKDLKEIEIIEYPNHSKFMDYKSTKIDKKKLMLHRKQFFNSSFQTPQFPQEFAKLKFREFPNQII